MKKTLIGISIIFALIIALTAAYIHYKPSFVIKKAINLALDGEILEARKKIKTVGKEDGFDFAWEIINTIDDYNGVWTREGKIDAIVITGTTVQNITNYDRTSPVLKSTTKLSYEELTEMYVVEGESLHKKLYLREDPDNTYPIYSFTPKIEYVPQIGMSKEKLEESIWGKPKTKKKIESKDGKIEQWEYWNSSRIVTLKNDKVIIIEE